MKDSPTLVNLLVTVKRVSNTRVSTPELPAMPILVSVYHIIIKMEIDIVTKLS